MINHDNNMLLYIEPKDPKSTQPIVDDLTRQLTAAYRRSQAGILEDGQVVDVVSMGWHTCICGAKSDNTEHVLPRNILMTNSLCVHYLAWHRHEIPSGEIDKLTNLPEEQADPSSEELQ